MENLRKSCLIFFIILLSFDFVIPTGRAQVGGQARDLSKTTTLSKDAKHFMEVGLGLVASPLRFKSDDWKKIALTASSVAFLFTVDKTIRKVALKNQNDLNDRIFRLDQYYGNIYTPIVISGIYGAGFLFHNSKVRQIGLHSLEAFIYSGTITGIIKIMLGRRRPYAGDNHLVFKPFRKNNDFYSLPSGHTTVTFAVSRVMASSINKLYWKVLWYGAASLVGASRIYHNQHWLSDVFLGGVIGYAVGDYVVHFSNAPARDLKIHQSIRIRPYLSRMGVGLEILR